MVKKSSTKLSGYPSIDMPQLQYYLKEPKAKVNPNSTVYHQVFDTNSDILDCPALAYCGNEWTFRQLRETVDEAARAYVHLGIGFGDVVLIGSLNCPEAIIALLALNKIGAISKWFDLSAGEGDIIEYILSSKVKAALIMDILVEKFNTIISKTKLDKIIVFSFGTSMPLLGKFILSLKMKKVHIPEDECYISYNDFIKAAPKDTKVEEVPYDPKRVSVLFQSSGTTGKPKTIIHGDYAFGKMAEDMSYSDLPVGRGKRVFTVIPPWLAYGADNTVLMPMTLGSRVELYPFFAEEHVIQNHLGSYTIVFASPIQYRDMIKNKDLLKKKQWEALKHTEAFCSGGDKFSYEEHELFEKIYGVTLINGYGSNEGLGILTLSPICHNRYGTVGICKPHDVISAFDPDTLQEMPYNQEGEICSLTETTFLQYMNNPEGTEKVLRKHPDGKIWLHTGDLGTVDEEGFVTLTGRLARVIVRKAFKISAYVIEDEITACKQVKECVVVSVPDAEENNVPMAYVILHDKFKKDAKAIKEEIFGMLRYNLKEMEVPKYIQIVDTLPYTSNNKYDFRALEADGAKFVDSLKR